MNGKAKEKFLLMHAVIVLYAACGGAAFAAQDSQNPIEPGFVSIFNGKDLSGWGGDPRLWSVKDGVIHGRTTKENPARGNTFCIWRGGTLKNFILKIKFRIQNGNSGIQYRSQDLGDWRVSGYQAEVENNQGKVGFLYHERGRGWMVNVGDMMVVERDKNDKVLKKAVGKIADVKELIQAGELGDLYYMYALRVNLGRLRTDENALWSLGPHDVSVILHLVDDEPLSVAARGHCYLQPDVEDVVFVNLSFKNGMMAQIQLSWLDPRKERKLTIVAAARCSSSTMPTPRTS